MVKFVAGKCKRSRKTTKTNILLTLFQAGDLREIIYYLSFDDLCFYVLKML